MDFELLQYEKTDIWNEVLCFRPHLQPGHDASCSGITERLELRERVCAKCRLWLELLRKRDILG
jgi:hypothetical protein